MLLNKTSDNSEFHQKKKYFRSVLICSESAGAELSQPTRQPKNKMKMLIYFKSSFAKHIFL